jgi:hypothetical protein
VASAFLLVKKSLQRLLLLRLTQHTTRPKARRQRLARHVQQRLLLTQRKVRLRLMQHRSQQPLLTTRQKAQPRLFQPQSQQQGPQPQPSTHHVLHQ